MKRNLLFKLIKEQFADVQRKYSSLFLSERNGQLTISGLLIFNAEYNDIAIEGEYTIKVIIPNTYPDDFPIVRETGGKIPFDFHRNKNIINSLCLGAPSELMRKFSESKTLLYFIEHLLVPFLYSYGYYCQYGRMPFGELSHGGMGIVEYYRNILKVYEPLIVLKFLHILLNNTSDDQEPCPCNSGSSIRECHGNQLQDLRNIKSDKCFLIEYLQVKDLLKSDGVLLIDCKNYSRRQRKGE